MPTTESKRPTIVCLCGSGRFKQDFIMANFNLTMQGKIVLSVGWFSHDAEIYQPTENEKAMLDALHMQKIDLADEILVINIGGYIGESTRREIAYAHSQGKAVVYWEDGPMKTQGLYADDWFIRDHRHD